jgi:hypothetical protein
LQQLPTAFAEESDASAGSLLFSSVWNESSGESVGARKDDNRKPLSAGVIVGVVVAILFVLVVSIALFIVYRRSKALRAAEGSCIAADAEMNDENSETAIIGFEQSDLRHAGEFTDIVGSDDGRLDDFASLCDELKT